jgi:Predicted membrane protein, hemolysin III homolog
MMNYSESEERANALTHAVGIVLGIVAGYFLLSKAVNNGSGWEVGSVLAYLFGMMSSYVSSTWYHACSEPDKKRKLRKFDHAAIYLHIAGTYVPFTLVMLRNEGVWGWSLFGVTAIAAVVGVILSFGELKKHSHLKTICYVLMGCSILVAVKPLADVLSLSGQIDALYWLIGGGVSYIIGAVFYSWTKKIYAHTVFHLFVLGGSICHIIAIYKIL